MGKPTYKNSLLARFLAQQETQRGARLSLVGSALGASEVNTLIEQLQRHPLTGRAALGQLEIRRPDASKDGNSASGGASTCSGATKNGFSLCVKKYPSENNSGRHTTFRPPHAASVRSATPSTFTRIEPTSASGVAAPTSSTDWW